MVVNWRDFVFIIMVFLIQHKTDTDIKKIVFFTIHYSLKNKKYWHIWLDHKWT